MSKGLHSLLPAEKVLRIRSHFLRSIHLERDFADPRSSRGYILTDFTRGALTRICSAFKPDSTQRAWRITGDYGSGKSSLALTLARIASRQKETLPNSVHSFLPERSLEPILITGDREPVARGLLRGLKETCSRLWKADKKLAATIDNLFAKENPPSEEIIAVIERIRELVCTQDGRVSRYGKTTGLIIILDELGKFFEFAAMHPSRDDIYLLQRLAEMATRSGEHPIVVVGLLHQGVTAYSAGLNAAGRQEWNKVASRFHEIVFAQPLEQVASLVAATLDVDLKRLPAPSHNEANGVMLDALRLNWYGAAASARGLKDLAPRLFPLDPFVLPVLIRLTRRFSQNERSLFSFLSSAEPHGLMVHAASPIATAGSYRLVNLFDYVRSNLSHTLENSGSRGHWTLVDEVISGASGNEPLEIEVLKTVGLLNLLDASDLVPTRDVVVAAVAGRDKRKREGVERAIQVLTKKSRTLYERGSVRGLCLWPNTSVNLDEALDRGLQATSLAHADAARGLANHIGRSFLVPRQHYIQTGTLRAFEVLPVAAEDLAKTLAKPPQPDGKRSDGHILVVLAASEPQRAAAFETIAAAKTPGSILIAVPEVISGLLPLLDELKAWEWVSSNVNELAHDKRAREEVRRQRTLAKQRLERRAGPLLALRVPDTSMHIDWFHESEPVQLAPGRQLMRFLSSQCERIYKQSPRVRNELINRTAPSGAAVTARTKLTEQIATAAHLPLLGMDGTKTPPEMAIYLSVLQKGNVHVEDGEGWKLQIPVVGKDPLNLRHALNHIGEMLRAAGDSRIPIQQIFDALRAEPFGVRDGLSPLLLALYLAIEQHHVAVYEDGTYIHKIGGFEFMRMLKEPEFFEIQNCAIEGVRAEVFTRLATTLDIVNAQERPELLDVVRPLVVFAATIPDYARKTKLIKARTNEVRAVLLIAREPSVMLFRELPEACGFEAFVDGTPDQGRIAGFAAALQESIQELREAYPALLRRLGDSVRQNFLTDQSLASFRQTITDRIKQLMNMVSDPGLKTFMLRLEDGKLEERAWLESLGSTLVRKAPERWDDADEVEFHHQISVYARRFSRTEFAANEAAPKYLNGHACRLALTRTDGTEVNRLVHWEPQDDSSLEPLQAEITALLKRHPLGLAAATRALWASLEEVEKQDG